MMDGHPNWCAEVPHPLLSAYVYWCPANREWVMSLGEGTTDQPVSTPTVSFGPFDDCADVAHALTLHFGEAALRSLSAS